MSFYKKCFIVFWGIFVLLNIINVFATKLIDSPYDFGLKDYYPPMRNGTMKEVYEQVKAELPDEIPVVMPKEVKGEKLLFVSPSGSDFNEGTIDKPFKTIQKALRCVKDMSYEQRAKGVVIYLRKGIYKFTETLEIQDTMSGTKEAPLFISAYNNEDVTITSSDILTAKDFTKVTDQAKRSKLSDKAKDKVVVADLKSLGITEYGPIKHGYLDTEGIEPALYWSDTKMSLARWPNYDYIPVGKVIDPGPITKIESAGDSGVVDDGRGFEFELKDDRPLLWENTGDIYIYGFMCFEWLPGTFKLRAINKETKTLRSYDTAMYGVRETPGNRYYFFNVFEELDVPGEWYLDRNDGKLYIYPYDGMENASISFSTQGIDLIKAVNAKHVYFNGLKVKWNSESAFIFKNCENVVVQNCDVSLMGKYGINMQGCKYSGVTTSMLVNTDFPAVSVGGNDYNDNYLIPSRNFVQNCFISRQGNNSHYAGYVGGDTGDIVSHNLFQKFAAAAATPSGSDSVFEYNEIMGSPYEVQDMGAIYTGGVDSPYHQDRYNYIHDMSATGKAGNAIYYDVFGSTYMAYGNVLKNVATGIYSHGGINNVWVNNVIADRVNTLSPAVTNSYNYYNPNNPSWKNQILDKWSILGKHYRGDVDSLGVDHAARYPMMYRYILNLYQYREQEQNPGYVRGELENWLRAPRGHYISKNISFRHGPFNMEEVGKPVIDFDNNYVTQDDPGFVDYEHNNLNFKKDAKVYSVIEGFEPPPFDKMGLVPGTRWDGFGIKEAPMLINPSNNSVSTETFDQVVFKWTDVLCAGRYKLLVATDPDFKNIVINKDVDLSTSTEQVPQPGTTYYWKVIAIPMTKSLKQDTFESKVYSFTTMTLDEMNKFAKADKQYLAKEIDYSKKLCDSITEGEEVGQYSYGTKTEMLEAIKEAQKAYKNINIQVYINEALDTLKKKINKLRANARAGFVKLEPFTTENWKVIQNTEGVKGGSKVADDVTATDGVVTMKCKNEGQSRIGFNKPLQMGIMYTFKANIESTDGWMVIGKQKDINSSFTQTKNYCIVIKPDMIELQKYTESKSYFIIDYAVNDNKIIKPNTWHEYAFGTFAVEDGVRVVFMVDGKKVIDYIDKDNPLYYEGYLVTLAQSANKSVKFMESQLEYTELP